MITLYELITDFIYWWRYDRDEWHFVITTNKLGKLLWYWERPPDFEIDLENF